MSNLTIATLTGVDAVLSDGDIEELKSGLRGDLLRASDPVYDRVPRSVTR